MLPFVFMYYMKYLSIAVCLVLAYSLLGMEELSLEIEAPFGRCEDRREAVLISSFILPHM